MFEFERTVSMDMLKKSYQKIKGKVNRNSGVSLSEEDVRTLHYMLITGMYMPEREFAYRNKKGREIFVSSPADKVVQTALANVLSETFVFPGVVHSFIKNRSIFTANHALQKRLKTGETVFYKVDISKFFQSVSRQRLLDKIKDRISDEKFLNLLRTVMMNHRAGISTGSCLSPILSNIYLEDFDLRMMENSDFYLRYVDDMLISGSNSNEEFMEYIRDHLRKERLFINHKKTMPVDPHKGFQYLGFDVKVDAKVHNDLDALIESGDFGKAQQVLDDLSNERESDTEEAKFEAVSREESEPAEEFPKYILQIEKKCHVIAMIVRKAREEQYLSHPEKRILLYLYRPLGEAGERYIHHILKNCLDYDYETTQGYIERSRIDKPMGCKKICEAFYDIDKSQCKCNFSAEKIYPTPLIHAMRIDRECYHFVPFGEEKKQNKISKKISKDDAVAKMLDINQKLYNLNAQKEIFKSQLVSLFEQNGLEEIETPHGTIIKNQDGLFIKL